MEFQKILIIQTAFLGDVILTTPTIRAVKQVFPESQIDVLTIPETAVIFQYNPHVNATITFDKRQWLKKPYAFWKTVRQLREKKYDLAFSIQSSMTSSLLMLLGKIENRVGFARQKLLTHPVNHKRGLHIRKRYMYLLQPFSEVNFDSQTELFWSDNEEKRAQQIFDSLKRKGNFIVGIAPGSVWFTKRWLQQYYAALLQHLAKRNMTVVLFGSKGEQQLCQEIIDESQTKAHNLAGELSVLESAALIAKLDLMVTNDSAPLHISNAVKTDVIAIFGPTVRRFGCYPYRENDSLLEVDLHCRPCSKHGGNKCPEGHFRCMRDISPERVYNQIMTYFQKGKK